MPFEVKIPRIDSLRETIKIEKWLVEEGCMVKKGDVLFELETEKAILEVESKVAGILLKILIPAGREVPMKSVAAIIGRKDEKVPEVS